MNNSIIKKVLNRYKCLEELFRRDTHTWVDMQEDELWFHICFCILSSNVPFEMAQSATRHLIEMNLIDRKQSALHPKMSLECIASELSKPCYLPPKKNKNKRKYRFPNVRAKHIVQTAVNLQGIRIKDALQRCETDYQGRDFFVKYVYGMGYKESSMFLRNIGYSCTLAVIDNHILHFMKEIGLVDPKEYRIQSPKTYLQLEMLLRNFASEKQVELPILDIAIWQSMREALV